MLAVAMAGTACAYSASSHDHTSFYSWHPKGQPWHFGFFAESQLPRAMEQIRHPKEVIVGVPDLKNRLLRFRRGQNLAWRDAPPEFVYPPTKLLEDIRHFTQQRGVTIGLTPAISDP